MNIANRDYSLVISSNNKLNLLFVVYKWLCIFVIYFNRTKDGIKDYLMVQVSKIEPRVKCFRGVFICLTTQRDAL